jgi:hypothetical protein
VYQINVLKSGKADNNYAVLGYFCEPTSCTSSYPDQETRTIDAYWVKVK